MTPEAQRIAIAESCGWKFPFDEKRLRFDVYRPDGSYANTVREKTGLVSAPDYPNDLNAMHEAVMSLTDVQKYEYVNWLDEVTEPIGEPRYQVWSCIRLTHATAEQRAEAFLRTIGKWEE